VLDTYAASEDTDSAVIVSMYSMTCYCLGLGTIQCTLKGLIEDSVAIVIVPMYAMSSYCLGQGAVHLWGY
jgi:hypothetical protein